MAFRFSSISAMLIASLSVLSILASEKTVRILAYTAPPSAKAPVPPTTEPDIDLAPDPFTPAVNVLVRNPGKTPLVGRISLSNPDNFLGASQSVKTITVSPGTLGLMKFQLPGAAMVPDYRYSFNADFQSGSDNVSANRLLNFFRIERARTAPSFDGDMKGWLNASMIVMGVPGSYPGKKGWKGRADLTSSARFLWDADHLYAMVRRTDDAFQPASSATDTEGDRVRIAISPTGSHFDDAAWVTVDLVSLQEGITIVRHADSSLKLTEGIVKDAKVSLSDQNGVSVCVAAIPWKELGILKGVKLKRIGLTVRSIDDDGDGARSWLQWGDGADLPAKPSLFADASLGD
jgi:hypothetical protein